MIDFTGYTCTNCRLNEKNVFPRPEVQAELAKYVRVQLYTDGGKDGPKNQRLEQAKFGDVALPLYGVVNPQTGAVVDKVAGVISTGVVHATSCQRAQRLSSTRSPEPVPLAVLGRLQPRRVCRRNPLRQADHHRLHRRLVRQLQGDRA